METEKVRETTSDQRESGSVKKSGNFFGQGKLPVPKKNLTLTVTTCLMCFECTTLYNY
jgi:hypothetical protein